MTAHCIECGELTDWLLRLDVPRPTDPPMPVPICYRCAEQGRFRRRHKTMWVAKEDEQ